jgi:hypothetical protein
VPLLKGLEYVPTVTGMVAMDVNETLNTDMNLRSPYPPQAT